LEETLVFRDVYWLRDATSKAVRRVKKLIGRPDSTPWVLRPNRKSKSASGADLLVVVGPDDEGAPFIRTLRRAMAPYALVLQVARGTAASTSPVCLDLSPEPHPQLAAAHVIADRARREAWADRARTHQKLKDAGVTLPSAADYLARRTVHLPGRTSYLRGYSLLGARTLLWWTPDGERFEPVGWDEVRQHELLPAVEIVDRLARLTELDYFSCEVAVTTGSGQPRFVLTDLSADPRDLIAVDGRPDEWTTWACERIADFVWRKKNEVAAPAGHSMWLPNKSGAAVGEAKPSIVTAA
jgi:hypothetical protein